mgnify:CR=1 FL=1
MHIQSHQPDQNTHQMHKGEKSSGKSIPPACALYTATSPHPIVRSYLILAGYSKLLLIFRSLFESLLLHMLCLTWQWNRTHSRAPEAQMLLWYHWSDRRQAEYTEDCPSRLLLREFLYSCPACHSDMFCGPGPLFCTCAVLVRFTAGTVNTHILHVGIFEKVFEYGFKYTCIFPSDKTFVYGILVQHCTINGE